jgi:hypothetical protein
MMQAVVQEALARSVANPTFFAGLKQVREKCM